MDDELSDHDLLIRIDERLAKGLETLEKHENRICELERCQNKWLGRDGAIVSGIAIVVSLITAGVISIGRA